MNSNNQELVRKRMAARVRRLLHWMQQEQGNAPMDEIIKNVIANKLWPLWGYPRLAECLTEEFHLSTDKASEIVINAIKGGYENEKLYGVDDNSEQPAKQAE